MSRLWEEAGNASGLLALLCSELTVKHQEEEFVLQLAGPPCLLGRGTPSILPPPPASVHHGEQVVRAWQNTSSLRQNVALLSGNLNNMVPGAEITEHFL